MRKAQEPQEFSVSRLAKRWGRTNDFVVNEIKSGLLEARRIGGRHLRVHLEEVLRYEAEHGTVQANGPPA